MSSQCTNCYHQNTILIPSSTFAAILIFSFIFVSYKIRWDDYGELIKPEEWIDLTMDTSSERRMGSGQIEDVSCN